MKQSHTLQPFLSSAGDPSPAQISPPSHFSCLSSALSPEAGSHTYKQLCTVKNLLENTEDLTAASENRKYQVVCLAVCQLVVILLHINRS